MVKKAKTCRYCGLEGLSWMFINGWYMLGDGRKIHECPANPFIDHYKIASRRKVRLDENGYPEEWTHELREEVRARHAWRCGYCGKHQRELPERLSVHHKNRDKTDCRANNLIPLCLDCHILVAHNGHFSELTGQELNIARSKQEDRREEERDRKWEQKKLDKERNLEYGLRRAGLVPGV